MLRLIILYTFLLSIDCYSQTESYLYKEDSNESIEDIVKLLNIKNAKEISIYCKEKGKDILLGNIILNEDGKCVEKSYSRYGYKYYYTYNNDSSIDINDSDFIVITGGFLDTPPPYNGDSNNYTYNSDGYLIRYFKKGFFHQSSFSEKDTKGYENNELEYKFDYNKENQIIKFYKRIQTTCTKGELTTEFNYINDNIIEVKCNKVGHRFPNEGLLTFSNDKLLYKIKYY